MMHIGTGLCRISAAAVAACVAFGGASAAQAQEGNWYIGANMPLMFTDDSDASAAGSIMLPGVPQAINHSETVKSEHDTGFKIGGVLGYHLEGGLRLEGEVFMARAEVSKLTFTYTSITANGQAVPTDLDIPVSGKAEQFGAMLNLWYDFDTGDDLIPYIGGGLGLIRIDQGDVKYDANQLVETLAAQALQGRALPDGYVPVPGATDTAFAYQFGAGIGYALSDTATLQLGYRLQALDGLEFSGMNANGAVKAKTDLQIHFLEIGIRQRF